MVTVAAEKTYTIEEYFELEKNSETRHEFYYGKLIEMPGESKTANKIANNILAEWRKPLLNQGFECYTHDVKAEIRLNKLYRYPDLVVTPESDNADDYIVKAPVIMVEVASEKSWRTDTGAKRREYANLPTLKYYLIVSQEEPFVELCIRKESDWTFVHFEDLNETIELANFNLKITLSDIYHRVKFGEPKTDL